MKTLKALKIENAKFYSENVCLFKVPYSKKMGGTQTIQIPHLNIEASFNDKEFYNGRGAKYNNDNMHDNKGVIIISEEIFNEKVDNRAKMQFDWQKEKIASKKEQKQNLTAFLNGEKLSQNGLYLNGCWGSKKINIDIEKYFENYNLFLRSDGKKYLISKCKKYYLYQNNGQTISIGNCDYETFVEDWGDRFRGNYLYLLCDLDLLKNAENLFIC